MPIENDSNNKQQADARRSDAFCSAAHPILKQAWWLLLPQLDKVPASHTDWLCWKLAGITEATMGLSSRWVAQEKLRELNLEIDEMQKANWPNARHD